MTDFITLSYEDYEQLLQDRDAMDFLEELCKGSYTGIAITKDEEGLFRVRKFHKIFHKAVKFREAIHKAYLEETYGG